MEVTLPVTGDMEVTLPVTGHMEFTLLVDTKLITLALTKLSVHMDERFLVGPNDCFVLSGYVDHAVFRLWQEDACICYVELEFIYY